MCLLAVALTGKEHPVKKDGCNQFIRIMITLSVINPVLVVLSIYSKNPLASRFLYHVIASDKERTPLFYIYGFAEFVGQVLGMHPWLMIFFVVWTYTQSMSYWLNQMKLVAKFSKTSLESMPE